MVRSSSSSGNRGVDGAGEFGIILCIKEHFFSNSREFKPEQGAEPRWTPSRTLSIHWTHQTWQALIWRQVWYLVACDDAVVRFVQCSLCAEIHTRTAVCRDVIIAVCSVTWRGRCRTRGRPTWSVSHVITAAILVTLSTVHHLSTYSRRRIYLTCL